jgi:hypothetical protein
MNDRLQIGELVLRVPDLDAGQARRLVDEVLERIRAGLPAEPKPATLRRIDLRLTLPRGIGREAIAERIARAVLDALAPGGRHG